MDLAHQTHTTKMKHKKMLNVHFFLLNAESNQNPDKALTIKYQLEIEGQKRDTSISTSIKIPHKFWWAYKPNQLEAPPISDDGQPQFVINTYFEAEHINKKLMQIRQAYKEIFASLQILSNDNPSYYQLREMYDHENRGVKRKIIPRFLEVLDEMLVTYNKKRRWDKGTFKNYQIRRKNIETFFKAKRYSKLLVTEVKYKHIEELIDWMDLQTDEQNNQLYGQDHRNKHATCMKTVLDFAVNREYLPTMPVAKLQLEYSTPKPPNYLRRKERLIIENCDAPSVERIKDVAIFLMYTGFSYVDYMALTEDSLDGLCWKVQRDKSDIYALPPLFPQAAKIIEKYGGISKLPKYHISDLNKGLKHLGDFAKIHEKTVGFSLSSSVFRETFASMLENEFMLDRKLIKFMMGHKHERQLNNYSTVQGGKIIHEMFKASDTQTNIVHQEYKHFIEKLKAA